MSLYKYVQTFLWNIRDSFRFSLRELYKRGQRLESEVFKQRLDDDLLIEQILYEIPSSNIQRPKIKTAEETIYEILNSTKSIARFGDGEIMVADCIDIAFQKADVKLSKRLKEILITPQENLLLAINRRYYYPNAMTEIIKRENIIGKNFNLYEVPLLRRRLDKYINLDITYYEAGISEGNFETYREFFNNKKLVLVGCKEAFESYEFNIFDTALKLDYEFVPNKHCFSVYDEILTRLLNYDKDTIRILMCGPTASVLAADLTKEGFRALDLGHLAKFYDWHKRGIDIDANDGQNTLKFYSPDE